SGTIRRVARRRQCRGVAHRRVATGLDDPEVTDRATTHRRSTVDLDDRRLRREHHIDRVTSAEPCDLRRQRVHAEVHDVVPAHWELLDLVTYAPDILLIEREILEADESGALGVSILPL